MHRVTVSSEGLGQWMTVFRTLQGAEVWGTSAKDAQAFVAGEVARWTKVVRDEKISSPN